VPQELQDDDTAMPVQSPYIAHHAHQNPNSNAAMILFTPRNRPTGKGRAQPYPSPLPRHLSRASSASPTPGPSNRPLGHLIPPDFDLSDSEPENLAPAIAALDLGPQSDSSPGSDLLPTPAPRGTVMQPARRKGAVDVWTFYEDKDRRKCCAFCLLVLNLVFLCRILIIACIQAN
jgi:hypothetical protein